MKKRLLSLLICMMVAVSTISFVGCGGLKQGDITLYEDGMAYTVSEKGEALPVYSLSYEIMGGKDVMPIGGYYGLYESGGSLDGTTYPNHVSDKAFADMAEMGINMVVYVPNRVSRNSGLYKTWYELGEKYGIGLFANNLEFEMMVGTRTVDPRTKDGYVAPTAEWLYNLVKDSSHDFQYKSFLGLWAMDETYANHQLDQMADLIPLFYNCGLPEGIDAYCNGLGYWEGLSNVSNTFTGGGWTYEEYYYTGKSGTLKDGTTYSVRPYSAAGLKMLSTTEYPIVSPEPDDEIFSAWFQNLAQLLGMANEFKIPYWRMMQAGGEFYRGDPDMPYYPTEGQWMLDINSALAFGAKAIQYYELSGDIGHNTDNDGTHDYGRNGMVGADGKKNQWWYYGKNAAKQIQEIDHVLMNASMVGILPHGEQATAMIGELNYGKEGESFLITTRGWRQLSSVKGDDVFMGCFDYKGGSAYYVVNSSVTDEAEATLRFDDKYLYTVSQRGQSVDVVGTAIPLTLAPGEGALVVVH